MGWVSPYLRRAIVEIDRVSASEVPLDSGAGINWRSIFDQVGWDVTVYESNINVLEPSGESWSDAECHQAMLTWRDSVDLDSQWRYHLLCVRRLDSTSRGIMYDAYGGDSNGVPREGAAMSSHWLFTNDPVFPEKYPWGQCAQLRFGQCTRAYFRTAVHEIGHAIMMFHPSSTTGNHIMQVTPQIAANAVPPFNFRTTSNGPSHRRISCDFDTCRMWWCAQEPFSDSGQMSGPAIQAFQSAHWMSLLRSKGSRCRHRRSWKRCRWVHLSG